MNWCEWVRVVVFDRANFCFFVESRLFEVEIAKRAGGLVTADSANPGPSDQRVVFDVSLIPGIDCQAFWRVWHWGGRFGDHW